MATVQTRALALLRDMASVAGEVIVRRVNEGAIDSGGLLAKLVRGTVDNLPPPPQSRNLLKLYQTSPWIHSITHKIASSCAEPTWYFEDRKGKRIMEHPALEFLSSGSEFLAAQQALEVHYLYMEISGESFWVIGRDEKGKPASFQPCPTNWVTEIQRDDNGVVHFTFSLPFGGGQIDLTDQDVIWFKKVDPLNPLGRGTSIIRSMNTEIEIDRQASEYLYWFMRNRARPDLLITGMPNAPLQEGDIKRLEELWLPRFQGVRQAGRPFFSANELNVKELGAKSLRDQQMVEARGYQASLFAQLFNIPPEILGRLENSNRATVDGADYHYAKHVIVPRVRLSASVLQARVRHEYRDTAGWKLCFVTPIQEDRELQLKAVVAAPWAFSRDDVREIAGKAPLGGSEGEERPPMPSLPAPDATGGKPPATGEAKKPKGTAKPKVFKSMRQKLDQAAIDVVAQRILEMADDEGDIESFKLLLREAFIEAGFVHTAPAAFELPVDGGQWIDARSRAMMKLTAETTASSIQDALSSLNDTHEKGITRDEAAAAVIAVFGIAVRKRVNMIAETEANTAAGFGSISALRFLGKPEKEWRTQADDRVRHEHKAMHGQVKGINEEFVAPNGDRALHPGGFSSVDLNAGCRCFTVERGSSRTYAEHAAMIDKHVADMATELQDMFERQRDLVMTMVASLFNEG